MRAEYLGDDFQTKTSNEKSGYNEEKGVKIIEKNQIPQYLFKTNHNVANITYIDKEENMLRVPTNIYENTNHSKRPPKKTTSKRTIQKIIKKGKSKTRKIYVNAVTRSPTEQTERNDRIQENQYTQSIEEQTTEVSRKKKYRKSKLARYTRYPIPFHSLHSKNNHKYKRSVDPNLYILQDLDEMEFLSGEGDYNIVKAHVKSYW